MLRLLMVSAAFLFVAACASPEARELDRLIVEDSTYLVPETGEPFSGPVFSEFDDDPGRLQMEGTLRDGVWHGELTVYHPNGRIRYQGRMVEGTQCGAWIQNRDSVAPERLADALKQDIESLGMYPECPDGR